MCTVVLKITKVLVCACIRESVIICMLVDSWWAFVVLRFVSTCVCKCIPKCVCKYVLMCGRLGYVWVKGEGEIYVNEEAVG